MLLIAILLVGCAPGMATIEPPEIRYGEDLCAECNMIISDVRFAASYVHEIAQGRYASLSFDDIGDMLAHAESHADHKIVAWYVHDYSSEEWIKAEESYFVVSDTIRSPMGFGIAAYETQADAEAMAAEAAVEIVRWTDLMSMELSADHMHEGH